MRMIETPEWVKNAVFYQIFPDRFARSERVRHARGIVFRPWGSPPEEQGYQGGDLYGVAEKLDYLKELGINAIYLNPIFSSASNHRYHTFDYMQVDPLLGGDEALRYLLDEAHARGMYVVLDGVFNHASRGFWAFHHILENGGDSPYIDWFTVNGWPLRPYNHDDEKPHNYSAWWGLPALPKLNTNNPGVRDYIYEVAKYWLDFGIDGWRLDVPTEIDDDEFWRGFRNVVKGANPEAYIVGEIWHAAQRWLAGDQFDAVMNYIFADKAMSFFGGKTLNVNYELNHFDFKPLDAPAFAQAIDAMHGLYDWQINHVQLNLLDSHDTARALWVMGGDKQALMLCALFQMTMPGAPCVYYGTEVGLSAGTDPYCREAFPWHKRESWAQDLLLFYKAATAVRHAYPALRTGEFVPLCADGMLYGFARNLGDEQVVCLFNAGENTAVADLALAGEFTQVWPVGHGRTVVSREAKLVVDVPARAAVILVRA